MTGLSLSLGLAILIIGLPFFLGFTGITRVISPAAGPGLTRDSSQRIIAMLRDART